LELRAADAESLRVMLELDLRAVRAEPPHALRELELCAATQVWAARDPEAQPPLVARAPSSQPSAANAGTRALLSLREYVARAQAPLVPAHYIIEAQPARRAPAKRRTARKRDDLQRIKGIGPSMAERLAKAGVTTFESIARWKAKDMERMAEKLGVSRARIERQEWAKQARALARKR
jgi:predicted flap endonuclease-1-like 5' DNA nuclease